MDTPTPAFPATDSTFFLPGPAGALELAVEWPDPDTTRRAVVAVLCHPLPTEGGSMHNKVVTMAARALRELGAITVRFNFRGTGQSAGAFDEGNGETEDLAAVVRWVREQRPDETLWLAGFSFGAYVSIRSAAALQPAQLISMAPPAGRWDFESIQTPAMPWLVIQGEADDVVEADAVRTWLQTIAPPQLTYVSMPDTSHFFHGKLVDLRGAIRNGVAA